MNDGLLAGRFFRLWDYQVSLGELLIRSPKSDQNSTEVDVLFKGVRYLSVARTIGFFAFADPTEAELQLADIISGEEKRGCRMFVLQTEQGRHIVIADDVTVTENDLS